MSSCHRLVIARFILLTALASIILSGCTWLDGVRYGVYPADDQERYEMGIDNGPVLYSHLGPKGEWAVRSDYRRIRAKISFESKPYPGVIYHFDTDLVGFNDSEKKEVSLESRMRFRFGDYDEYQEKLRKLKDQKRLRHELFFAEEYDDYYAMIYTQEFLRHLKEDQKRRGLYYKVVEVKGLKCSESGDYRHIGPSPDPAMGGQWAGMGAYERSLGFGCPLRRGNDKGGTWSLSVRGRYTIADSSKLVDKEGNQLTLEDIDRDFKERIFWALDSLELYGFDQKPYESE